MNQILLKCICLSALTVFTHLHELSNLNADDAMDAGWRFILREPSTDWYQPGFDDSKWQNGTGGFGTTDTPGARVSTIWSTRNIWLRRDFELVAVPARPALLLHHDDDVEIFINGKQVFTAEGYTTEYGVELLSPEAASVLKPGKNVLAIHCKQKGGGQHIDVHVVDADHVPKLRPPVRPTKPLGTKLMTQWGETVTADNAWTQYPRPSLVRNNWRNLNGYWEYAITSQSVIQPPDAWSGKVLVPFAIESKLSGVERLLDPDEALWYRRTVQLDPQPGHRMLLNFEAVDYRCQVAVNGRDVGGHIGGNSHFSLDITEAARPGDNEIVVRVEDDTEAEQLNGKQSLTPKGIWYTRVSGIWQTVWLEQVPGAYVAELDIITDPIAGTIDVTPTILGDPSQVARWSVSTRVGNQTFAADGSQPSLRLKFQDAILWSPANPHLYELNVRLYDSKSQLIDEIESYAGIRSVGKTKDADGRWRFTLNGKILFHFGPLDQGWWPDGLLTPPSDEAMLYDIEFLRDAGFNMIRKHIKVEPRRYYYHCDRLGMMVWQDQVSGHPNPPWIRMSPNPVDANWKSEDHQQFMAEFEEMIDELEFHPSVVVWTAFNEAWGQHQTVEVGKWALQRDPLRVLNIASGGNFWPIGDVADHHNYPHPHFPFDVQDWSNYIRVVGEFGGHGWPVEGHLYDEDRENWGYGQLPKNQDEYFQRYEESIRRLLELKSKGIAAGVYTQTTDVEIEINGLMTYDRKVIKIPADVLRKLHAPLYEEE